MTLDFDIAKWFNCPDRDYKSVVLKNEIYKENVLSHFTRRKKFENIIDYENVNFENYEIIQVYW